ncbi:terminase small subunit [Ralstonia phage Claudette]|uniref:Terminase small subunit n=2 Tax=Gervaisevirus claudettte TaxID=2846041 RepID=A0A7G5B870_9CAUD|nr:terminase small subunit [Ralstonia phage Claudette]QMV32493.1 terminase small subunit [Ralstonia phage Alix]QMV32746.1 terminase small subunit [Ralstonia phage Claudette]
MSQGASTKKKGSNRAGKSDAAKDAPLSPRQERFVEEYLKDSNATQAAIRAGYSPGKDNKAAQVQANRLLSYASVIRAIEERRAKLAKKFELTRERLLEEYCKLAFSDPRKFFREDGTLKTIPELDDETAAALAHFEVMEEFDGSGENRMQVGYTSKVKWTDKRAALDSIARVMGWNQDKMKLQGDAENPLTMLLKQVSGTAFTPHGEGQPED